MPHRKLVQIGTPQKLPTIREFLTEMAERQRDEIRRLKAEALHGEGREQQHVKSHPPDKLVPDPWQLHPVRRNSTKPKSKKSSRKRNVRK